MVYFLAAEPVNHYLLVHVYSFTLDFLYGCLPSLHVIQLRRKPDNKKQPNTASLTCTSLVSRLNVSHQHSGLSFFCVHRGVDPVVPSSDGWVRHSSRKRHHLVEFADEA